MQALRIRDLLGYGLGILTGLTAFALALAIRSRASTDPDLDFYSDVRDLVARTAVGDPDPQELTDAALRGLCASIDRHGRYYSGEEVLHLERETSGAFRGLGVLLYGAPQDGLVHFCMPGSPAERAGLAPRDRILSIDGRALAGLEPAEIAALLARASAERALVLDLQDPAGGRRAVELVPSEIHDATVRHERLLGEGGSGYLAITAFTNRTPLEFDAAVSRLRGQGARSLVIDLRGNPGGVLDAAVEIANRFIPEGRLVIVEAREGVRTVWARSEAARLAGMRVALLVDGGSASAAEVLAGALADHGVAELYGSATYGKGSVQTLTTYEDRPAVVKVTTARYLTPSGQPIEGEGSGHGGLVPDHAYAATDEEARQVAEWLASYDPPESALAALAAWEAESGEELRLVPPQDGLLALAAADLARSVDVGRRGGE